MSNTLKYPSTLTYRDRLKMAKEEPYEYNRVYAGSQTDHVWGRLTTDASVRLDRAPIPFQDGVTATLLSPKQSGFVSNTVPAVITHTTLPFKSGKLEMGLPVDQQKLIVEKRFKKKYPLNHLAAIRPETETISQTMRMMGTYSEDYRHAQRLGVHIPSACPGGADSYHPDVSASGYGLSPTLPRLSVGQSQFTNINAK